MKIITNDGMYIQKSDIAFLIKLYRYMPNALYGIYIKLNNKQVTMENRFEFIKLTDLEQIEYIKRLDYIIDYYQYKDMPVEEIYNAILEIRLKIEKYNSIKEYLPKDECYRLIFFIEQLDYQAFLLQYFLILRLSLFKPIFKLPENIEYPAKKFNNYFKNLALKKNLKKL